MVFNVKHTTITARKKEIAKYITLSLIPHSLGLPLSIINANTKYSIDNKLNNAIAKIIKFVIVKNLIQIY
jgi:hypothetical protein